MATIQKVRVVGSLTMPLCSTEIARQLNDRLLVAATDIVADGGTVNLDNFRVVATLDSVLVFCFYEKTV